MTFVPSINAMHHGITAKTPNFVNMTWVSPAIEVPAMLLKGHFDGKAIVLDEPATLAVGQVVQVIVETALPADLDALRRRTDGSLKPTRDGFAASGMTDDELAEFLEIEAHSMRGIPYQRE